MPDEPKKQPSHEGLRITVIDDSIARYWTKRFHINEQRQKTNEVRADPPGDARKGSDK